MNYRLLTTAIVTALDASNPTLRGTVWNPEEILDIQEAEALEKVGIAEQTKDKPTVETAAVRNANKAKEAPLSGVAVNAILQPDGTYKSDQGVRVNADGTAYKDGQNEELIALLQGSVPEIVDALDGLDEDQLQELRALEEAGKARKGVLDGIAQYFDPE